MILRNVAANRCRILQITAPNSISSQDQPQTPLWPLGAYNDPHTPKLYLTELTRNSMGRTGGKGEGGGEGMSREGGKEGRKGKRAGKEVMNPPLQILDLPLKSCHIHTTWWEDDYRL